MAKYVDSEVVKDKLSRTLCLYKDLPVLIDSIPAADVRSVVVCANCEHNNACLTQAFVEEESRVPFDRSTFFCADGKRANDV